MTHLYIKICDLCGKPAEMGSQMHAGHISTDIMVRTSKKVSMSVLREEYDVCIDCLNKTGLYEILIKMQEMKKNNKGNVKTAQQLLEQTQVKLGN